MTNERRLWYKKVTRQKITYGDIGLDTRNCLESSETLEDGIALADDIDMFRELGALFILTVVTTIAFGILFDIM